MHRRNTIMLCALLLLCPAYGMAAHASPAKKSQRQFTVPILMFHYIRELSETKTKEGKDLSVSPEKFAKDMEWLVANGYHTITFAELAATGSTLPEKPVILTFDDGYQDAFTDAFPELSKEKMTGTFFIVTGFLNTPNYVTDDELKTMQSAGMEIAAHTTHHKDLKTLSATDQKSAIVGSIQALSDRFAVRATAFAYPSGKYNNTTLSILKKTGIRFAVTTHHGIATDKMNPLLLPRLRINDRTNVASLLAGTPTVYARKKKSTHS